MVASEIIGRKGKEEDMKVLTKCVNIDGEEFVLIENTQNDKHFYGTIPYTELDEHGRMKRGLDGFEMVISFVSAADALEQRKRRIKQQKLMAEYIRAGLDRDSAIIKSVMES